MMKNQRELEFITLLGKFLSLNATENEMLRKPGNFNEPRVHFCAQSRIHRLAGTAQQNLYRHVELEQQLEATTHAFLSDQSRNRVNEKAEKLEVSEILDWLVSRRL